MTTIMLDGHHDVLLCHSARACIRLAMFQLSERRTLLGSPIPERELEAASEVDDTDAASSWRGPRTGKTLPDTGSLVRSSSDVSLYLMSKALTSARRTPLQLVTSALGGEATMGELLFIIRPVLYGMLE